MSKSSWKQPSCVYSGSDAYESDRELMGTTDFCSCEHSTTASPLWHCQRITQEEIVYILDIDTDLGSEGGRDKAQILR